MERGLYGDLGRIVEHRERTGAWEIERTGVEGAAADALASVCRAPPEAREGLDRWLGERIEVLGGPAQDAYVRRGRDRGAVEDLLFLERVRALLSYARAHADADCPFWVEPDPEFDGLQANASGFGLLLESIGSGAVLFQNGKVALGGFGGGRILPAWAFSEHVMLALGFEGGGAGSFPENETGSRELVARFSMGVPLLLRLRRGTTLFDVELAGTNRFTESDLPFRPGFRASIALGLTTLRSGAFLPFGVLWLGYELTPGHDGAPDEHALRFGTRVGVDWLP